MDKKTIRLNTFPVNTTIELPVSKSIANRLLCIKHLSKESINLTYQGQLNDDIETMLRLLHQHNDQIYDAGPAGTVFRFLTAYLAIQTKNTVTLTGSSRMKERPVGILVDALRTIGAKIDYLEKKGYPPLKISKSKLVGKLIKVDASVSSQYLSALALIGPLVKDGLAIQLSSKQVSRPYFKLTLDLMQSFGIRINKKGQTISIQEGAYQPDNFLVENDWSAASYAFQTVALSPSGSSVILKGLSQNSLQGDSALPALFAPLGVQTEMKDSKVYLTKRSSYTPEKEINLINQPDLAQTLVVSYAALQHPAHFSGLQTLTIKETDRLQALKTELEKLGANISLTHDSLTILKGIDLNETASIETYHDHRMAMAFAPLACVLSEITILDPNVVNKSYPTYWNSFNQLFS